MSADVVDVFGADVFGAVPEGADLDDAVADGFAAGDPVEFAGPELRPGDVIRSDAWFVFSLLTVPDVDRFPVPAEFSAACEPVDLSGLAGLSAADTRRLIQPALSDEQLQIVKSAELARDKPRGMVMRAIEAAEHERADRFPAWVRGMAANPLTCRVAAVGWMTGHDGLPDGEVCGPHEYSQLVELLGRWREWCQRLGFRVVAAVDVDWVLRVLTARLAYYGLTVEAQELRAAEVVQLPPAFGIAKADAGLTLWQLAEAVGVDLFESSPLPSELGVWQIWRDDPAAVVLADWAASRVDLEAAILRQACGLWDR